MLKLSGIRKTYRIGDFETHALDGIDVSFRESEFVAILGPSGSGKTTCLNIIGGLDRYDSGEMTIKGKNTRDFRERDWDAYRNNSIGFVFQNYNLISHLSIEANVELSMALSGVSAKEKRRRAQKALEEVGLLDHIHKKPNQLSGGQMQRVAIARALVNDPEILLCDEPTGALDTVTSVQIMDLIKVISKERLVIVVTHNPELAEQYADRIIKFSDGQIVSDSNPYEEQARESGFSLKKTSMSFLTALRLSFNNIRTKIGRTSLTAFASSIGIIGIALILSLSTGLKLQIDKIQSDFMTEYPIVVMANSMSVDRDTISELAESEKQAEFADTDSIIVHDPDKNSIMHKNELSQEYLDYVEKVDSELCNELGLVRTVSLNMLRIGESGMPVPVVSGVNMIMASSSGMGGGVSVSVNTNLYSYPIHLNKDGKTFLESNYDLLSGSYPGGKTDMLIVTDTRNRVPLSVMKCLGFTAEDGEEILLSDLVGMEFRMVTNDDYYAEQPGGMFLPGTNYREMYDSENSVTLRISGIIRPNKDSASVLLMTNGLVYSDELAAEAVEREANSAVVKAQKESDSSVFSGKPFTSEDAKKEMLMAIGGSVTPHAICLYPADFGSKGSLLEYLDGYNTDRPRAEQVDYIDMASVITSVLGTFVDGISYVLIAFAAVSLVVSLIMIGIITYTSVLERTKEIGILKALGARKKDVTRVFDAETCILGILSGVLGVLIAWLLTFPANAIIEAVADLKNVAQLQPLHALTLVIVSTLLTMLGGHLPARMASKKDAVEALRSE